jgi:hypothetical protein
MRAGRCRAGDLFLAFRTCYERHIFPLESDQNLFGFYFVFGTTGGGGGMLGTWLFWWSRPGARLGVTGGVDGGFGFDMRIPLCGE